ncbi:hypothetical protein OF829_00820 [Sphingomonas sp. LB-2]|uniref:hypothetical protein n=1 Tax=Sphingomonas caeni TaxID=2984949 RepID=UPI0022329653|nr:hypothetical protein [Sphingomonas caeni]MCW3845763.1 hypothetical protein [Sphingomonas caeni]
MAYREKLAAVNFTAMALVYAVYFTIVATRPPEARLLDMLWLFGMVATAHALVAIGGNLAVRIQSGGGAADERDRAIERRGASIAYAVLLVGMILVGVVMPFTEAPGKIVNTALFAIVIAELTHQGVILLSYRRGWHG